MDLIYKVTGREWDDGVPILQQMGHQGQATELFVLRFTAVWATSLRAARAIQRQYRESQREE